MKSIVLCIGILILTYRSISQEIKVPDQILNSAVLLTTLKVEGTGVFMSDSIFFYFVTARHNIFNLKTKKIGDYADTICDLIDKNAQLVFYSRDFTKEEPLIMNIGLDSAYNLGFIGTDYRHDVAVIVLGYYADSTRKTIQYFDFVEKNRSSNVIQTQIEKGGINKYENINLGNDIILVGYPSSIGLSKQPQFDYTRPLLRKGIVAGKYNRLESIIIDCPTFAGNSGGPVFERVESFFSISYKLIGIATEYIPYIENWENKLNGAVNVQTMNSGYTIVAPIDHALKLIQDMKDYMFNMGNYRNGNDTIFHKNGQIWTIREIKRGQIWTVFVNYNSSGVEMEKGTLKNGNGTLYLYDEKGKLETIHTFKEGVLVDVKNKN